MTAAPELRRLQGSVGNRTTVARIAAGNHTTGRGSATGSAPERVASPTVLRPVATSGGGRDAVMRDGDGRTTLAERQAHLRQVMLIRQLAAAGLGVTEREARRYFRIGLARTFADTLALATGRPAHRSVDDMVQLALGLPGLPIADIVGLAGAPAIGVPALVTLGTAVAGARPGAELAQLVTRLPTLTVPELAKLALIPGRPVTPLVRLVNGRPGHRTFDEAADLASALPAVGVPNILLLLGLPAARTVAHLRRLIQNKPGHRTIAFMLQHATAFPALSVPNVLALAGLPAGRDAELNVLATQRPPQVSITTMVALATALPARPATELVAIAALMPTTAQPQVIQLGQAAAHRSGADLAALRRGRPAAPVADLVTLANIGAPVGLDAAALVTLAGALNPRSAADLALLATQLIPTGVGLSHVTELGLLPRLTGAELVGLMQNRPVGMSADDMVRFLDEIDPQNLTAVQTAPAAAIEWAVRGRVPNPRLFLTTVLGAPALPGALANVATVVAGCPSLPPAALLTAMTRSPGNLANLVLHHADLDAAGALLSPALCTQVLAQDALIAAGDDVRTVVTAAAHMRVAALVTAMTRSPGNLANLVTHAADLDAAAVLLLVPVLKAQMLAQDALIAAGDDVRTVVTAAAHMRVAALLTAMTRAPGNLAALVANIVDLEAAAVTLNDVPSVAVMLGADHVLANGAMVRATVAAFVHIPPAATAEAMASALPDLTTLHARRVDIDRALTGEPGITGIRLLRVVDHLTANAALPALAADLDPQLRFAQSLGAELRHILLTPLGQPVNVAYLRNLAYAVNTQAGVVWGNRGGVFNSGGGVSVNFGAAVRVPLQVDGFDLTNHVIGHLVNPRDAHHQIRISQIRQALGYFAGTEIVSGVYSDIYQGGGLRLVTPQNGATIKTIFWV